MGRNRCRNRGITKLVPRFDSHDNYILYHQLMNAGLAELARKLKYNPFEYLCNTGQIWSTDKPEWPNDKVIEFYRDKEEFYGNR